MYLSRMQRRETERMQRRETEREAKVIKHFSHRHSLTLIKPGGRYKTRTSFQSSKCSLCNGYAEGYGEFYCCEGCVFVIHSHCAKLPQHFSHPFHPHHSLSPYLYDQHSSDEVQPAFQCDACGSTISDSLMYHCPQCKFYLHGYCCALQPEEEDIHPEDLIFVCNQRGDRLHDCSFCSNIFGAHEKIYVCIDPHRRGLYHEPCLRLPRRITHPFHPQHPLDLAPGFRHHRIKCNACSGGRYPSPPSVSPYYTCTYQCGFQMDTSCASLFPTNSPNPDQGQGHLHSHPLIQCDNALNQTYICSACQLRIQGSVFVCFQCTFFLDKSCSGLLREIRHPLHPQHLLDVVEGVRHDLANCCACKWMPREHTYFYVCRECDFQLDCLCAMNSSISETILLMSQVHDHPLAFLKTALAIGLKCSACYEPCENNFFQCVGNLSCEFALHIQCCPLPKTIKHDCHCDPLTLTYYPIEENFCDEDDDMEYYCFACEERRDPQDPSYCCKECHFVAHLLCVFSEVLKHIEAGSATRSSEVRSADLDESAETIPSEMPKENVAALAGWVNEENDIAQYEGTSPEKFLPEPEEINKGHLSSDQDTDVIEEEEVATPNERILKENMTNIIKKRGASPDEKFVREDFHIQAKDTIKKDNAVIIDQKIAKENTASQNQETTKKEIAAIDEEIAALQTRIEQLKDRRNQFLHSTKLSSA